MNRIYQYWCVECTKDYIRENYAIDVDEEKEESEINAIAQLTQRYINDYSMSEYDAVIEAFNDRGIEFQEVE